MAGKDELEDLRRRVAELEAENDGLRSEAPVAKKRRNPTRSILSAVALVLAILLAPVAVLGTWARLELVDTDRFVATFAPLADSPQVQSYVSDQIVTAIDDNVDIDGMVADLADGLKGLDLPPRAQNAIGLLTAPAADGIRGLINSTVDKLVASPAFADVWEAALRQTHSRAIAIIQGQPGTAITLSDDGTLSIQLDTVIEKVKAQLIENGFGFASSIPVIHKSIPLVTADAFVLVRTVYQVAIAAGYWLPWVALALAAAGIALARNRSRALLWTGIGLVASFLLLAAGLGIGKMFFMGTVSPSIMPSATAEVLFDQITEMMHSVIAALVLLSAFVVIGAWITGRSRPATALRTSGNAMFAKARESADRSGLNTKGFGTALDRWRPAIIVIVIALAVFILFMTRPVSVASVVWTVVGVLVALLVLEVLRRPVGTLPAEAQPDEDAEVAETTKEAEAVR
ncbi:hypothetical protein [Microbacterium sp. NPDC057650]|uniref:hypothetical protein n=1 Tax=unclassified Microbacterium TaxID=2609290 RepID=UPI003671F538